MKKRMTPEHKKLHENFQEYGRNAREWMRKCILMLLEIDDNRIWEQKGFSCIQEYAGKLSGMGRDTVNDGLRILKKTVNMPNIRKLIERKGINIIKPIESLLTVENEKSWADRAAKNEQTNFKNIRSRITTGRPVRKSTKQATESHFNF